jgi:hypothetical protein
MEKWQEEAAREAAAKLRNAVNEFLTTGVFAGSSLVDKAYAAIASLKGAAQVYDRTVAPFQQEGKSVSREETKDRITR